jgi:hypothetical protein
LSIAEDSVPDFLTKFGLITHLIDDINAFRAQVKASRSRQLDRSSKAQHSDEDLVTNRCYSPLLNVLWTDSFKKLKIVFWENITLKKVHIIQAPTDP